MSEDVDGDGIATMAGRHAVLDHPVDPAQDRRNAGFAYVDGVLADGDTLRLCRLRYVGSSHNWGFAIYRVSHDDYEDSFLPTGSPVGRCQTPSTPPAVST